MDVAIRAANWIATLALVAHVAVAERWFEPVLANLVLHGRFIRSHLEWAPVRGNHYLSDIVGLLAIASMFSAGREGRAWSRFAAGQLVVEIRHEVRADGCDHQASIPYHRLVAELFVCGMQAARALAPELVRPEQDDRVDAMLRFVADYTRPDGLAPQVGDADDGRYLPLGDYGRLDPRSHLHLFEQAQRPYKSAVGHAAYPAGGYWIMRADELYVLIRCGDVGVGGSGSHSHNDALSFELAYGADPLVIDPGTDLYTADPHERNRFRSTAFHSTIRIDGGEQNPISEAKLFSMEDRRRAEVFEWNPDPVRPSVAGRHHGYEMLPGPATHIRRVELDTIARALLITDRVVSDAGHDLEWTFPLAPCEATACRHRALAQFQSGLTLTIDAADAEFRIDDGWLSPSYGRRLETPFVRATSRSEPGEHAAEMILRVNVPH
jgi:heparinase II/III-like protein